MKNINLKDKDRKLTLYDEDENPMEVTILFTYEENGDEYLFVVLEDDETVISLKKQNDEYISVPEDEQEVLEQVFNEFIGQNEIYE